MTREIIDTGKLQEKTNTGKVIANTEKIKDDLFNVFCPDIDTKQRALYILQKDWRMLEFFPIRYRRNQSVVMEAIKQNLEAFCLADETLKKNKDFILKLVGINKEILRYVDEEFTRYDKEFIRRLFVYGVGVRKYIHEEAQENQDFMIEVFKDSYEEEHSKYECVYNKIDEEDMEDLTNYQLNMVESVSKYMITKSRAIKLLKKDRKNIVKLSIKHKEDPDIALMAIRQDVKAARYIDRLFFNNKDFITKVLQEGIYGFLKYVSDNIKQDAEFMFPLVLQYPEIYPYLGDRLKSSFKFNLRLFQEDEFVVKYFTEESKENPILASKIINKIIELYVFSNPKEVSDEEIIDIISDSMMVRSCVSNYLLHNRKFMKGVVKKIKEINKLRKDNSNNKLFMFDKIKENPSFVRSISEELKQDKDFILALKSEVPNLDDYI